MPFLGVYPEQCCIGLESQFLSYLYPLKKPLRNGMKFSVKGGMVMERQIQWETSLSPAKAKAKKGGKLILMDFYNNL